MSGIVDSEFSVAVVAAGEGHPVREVVLEVAVLLTAALCREELPLSLASFPGRLGTGNCH